MTAEPFGGIVLSVNKALDFIAHEDIFCALRQGFRQIVVWKVKLRRQIYCLDDDLDRHY